MKAITVLSTLAATGLLTGAAFAATRLQSQQFHSTLIAPGGFYSPVLACSSGELISGGYYLETFPDFEVVGSQIATSGGVRVYRVDVRNRGASPEQVNVSTTIVCQD